MGLPENDHVKPPGGFQYPFWGCFPSILYQKVSSYQNRLVRYGGRLHTGGDLKEVKQTGSMGVQSWERVVAGVAAAVVMLLIVYLVVRNVPFADPNLVVLTRIVLSLAVAVFGATVPGFLNVGWSLNGIVIRAGGALALFVLSLVFTPVVRPAQPSSDNSSQAHYNQGMTAYTLGHYADAVAHLSQVQSNSVLYRTAIGLKGGALFQQGRYDEALTAFNEARRVSKDRREDLQADYNIGLTYLYAKNYQEAREKLVPLAGTAEMQNDPAVIYNAAALLNILGELNLAKSIFARFPLSAPLPTDIGMRDIYAKAHWLSACLSVKSGTPDCTKVKEELAVAVTIAPNLRDEIEKDNVLDVCRKLKEEGK